jgi:hypothetical protein
MSTERLEEITYMTDGEFAEAQRDAYFFALRRGGGIFPPYVPEDAAADFCRAAARIRVRRKYQKGSGDAGFRRINSMELFESTHSVTDRLGELCSFVWASTVGMWHLRENVLDFVALTGERTEAEISDRFVIDTGVRSADLRTTCIKWSWADFRENAAKILLFDLCSLFEAWLEATVGIAMPAGATDKQTRNAIKGLQFPTTMGPAGPVDGFRFQLGKVTVDRSTYMENEAFPLLRTHRKNSWSMMEDLLRVYRYFKECRNALIHSGGLATQKAVEEFTNARPIREGDVGLAGPMEMPVLLVNRRITLSLPDVVAFSSIVHRMIITMDAALSVSKGSEEYMVERIRQHVDSRKELPGVGSGKRSGAIRSLARSAGVPVPTNEAALDTLLTFRGVI